jgi:hypothetical protein
LKSEKVVEMKRGDRKKVVFVRPLLLLSSPSPHTPLPSPLPPSALPTQKDAVTAKKERLRAAAKEKARAEEWEKSIMCGDVLHSNIIVTQQKLKGDVDLLNGLLRDLDVVQREVTGQLAQVEGNVRYAQEYVPTSVHLIHYVYLIKVVRPTKAVFTFCCEN